MRSGLQPERDPVDPACGGGRIRPNSALIEGPVLVEQGATWSNTFRVQFLENCSLATCRALQLRGSDVPPTAVAIYMVCNVTLENLESEASGLPAW